MICVVRIRVESEEPGLGVVARRVDTGSRAFSTPRRSVTLTASGPSEALASLSPDCWGLVELYRELTRDGLRLIDRNADRQRAFAEQLIRRINALPAAHQVVLLVLSLQDKGYCPRGPEAQYLADLAAAPFVQLTVVPRVMPKDTDEFLSYLADFLDGFSTSNGPALMGYIPNFAYREIPKVLNRYLRAGVHMFVMEYNGAHAMALYPSFLAIRRSLIKDVGDEWYIHGLNVGPGAFRHSETVCPSRDFLCLISGLDSIGAKHLVRRMPPEVWAKLTQKGGTGDRVFNRGDYGYYRPSKLRSLLGGSDPGNITLGSLVRERSAHTVRLYNTERQGLEAAAIRARLQRGRLTEYLRAKTQLGEDLERVRQVMRQATLKI